ncbi:dTMP kinase [Demequina sp. TTPB684]|uniref:dTMP kinase n=1 Tax=unclassified Demequina TaxID=2620311 RepID=UPI001CF1DED3|nr:MULTISPECIES: dTMP kinase [unclassified Demequina]MCB2413125.1 dTMP kinase [Demequina sp. TTPB684]UPU87513.1 dTMP kinase [Demequina sp. TMPB413]
MAGRGFWIVFEGGDGVGKSTQIDLLAAWLSSADAGARSVLTTREPGGTPLGIELRQAIMHGDHVDPHAEALLYAADRAHHIATLVRPALERGDVVVQDRYLDSSVVYQGGARGLGEMVESISMWATDGALPDLTVILDMEPRADRLDRDLDRVERETAEHAERMRHGFLERAARAPQRYAVVDAARPIAEVAADVREAVRAALERVGGTTRFDPASPGIEPWGTP